MITSEEIKKFILNPVNDLNDIIKDLDKYYKPTIEGIFNALFVLMKFHDQNISRIEYLINLLEQIIETRSMDEILFILEPITNLDKKLNALKFKERLELESSYKKIMGLIDKIENRSNKELTNSRLKYLEYLIFEYKDLSVIRSFLNSSSDILGVENYKDNDIIEELLYKFLSLNKSDKRTIDYYYKVLLAFFNSHHRDNILKNRDTYYNLIKNSSLIYEEHIIKVLELLNQDFKISLSELEEKHHLNCDFHPAIIKRASNILIENDNRQNYLYQNCFSIDRNNTSCIDDCLYIEKNSDNTYNLYVHIIDIASLIPYNSVINEEARNRVKTLYVQNNQILLYPRNITYDLGSLLVGESRNVISYIFKLNSNLELIEDEFDIKKAVIINKHNLSYEEADKIAMSHDKDDLTLQIQLLAIFASKHRVITKGKERYRLYENYLKSTINHESTIIDESLSANIVHETMVLTNYKIAKVFADLGLPYVFRRIIMPKDEYIEKQIERLKNAAPDVASNKKILRKLADSYLESMYWDTPVRHEGLKLECYSHSTSPARRYPDAYCQYLIHDLLINKNLDNLDIWCYRTKELVKYLNIKEKELESFTCEYNYLSSKQLIRKK